MTPQEELAALRRLAELEAKASAGQMNAPAQQSLQTGAQREARAFGLGVRDVAQGLGAIPGLLYNPIAAVGRAVGIPIRNLEENIDRAADVAGLPRAETQSERLASGIVRGGASAIPTMGAGALVANVPGAIGRVGSMLAANPGTQVVAGGASGAASQAAAEGGAGPIGQAAAGLAGGIGGAAGMEAAKGAGRFALSAFEPFTARGPERIAANVLLQSSADPEGLAGRVNAGMSDPTRRVPGAPATTAQAAQDPGLAILESGLRNDPTGGAQSPAVMLRNIEFARNQARQAALEGASPMPTGQAPDALGARVRQTLTEAQSRARANVGAAFREIEKDGPAQAPTAEIARRVGMAAHDIYGAGSGGMPQQLRAVLDDFQKFGDLGGMSNRDGVSTIQFLQNIRARLGSIGGQAATSGDNVLASAAKNARQALDQAVEDFAETGRGVDASQLEAWRKAIGMRREMGATFGRSGEGAAAVSNILRRDQFGAPMLADERVADAALASPTGIRQVLKAAGQEGAPVRQALKARFVDRFMEAAQTRGEMADAAGNRATPLSAAQAKAFWQRNQGVARELFTPEELSQFNRLMSDFGETAAMQGTAAARGSPTAQNLIVGNMIARTTGGLVDPTNPAAQTVVGLGPTLRLLYSAPEAATREALARALVDPHEASRILSLAGPQGAQMGAGYANQQFRDRLAQALMGEMVRGAARTGNALALQSQSGQQ